MDYAAYVAPDDLPRAGAEQITKLIIDFDKSMVGDGDNSDPVAGVLKERPVSALAVNEPALLTVNYAKQQSDDYNVNRDRNGEMLDALLNVDTLLTVGFSRVLLRDPIEERVTDEFLPR